MTLPVGYALAMDAQFRELSNFATPPRAGRITAIEASGQVRVETDDPDGGDVLAWPLDGFTYAVGDVVYLAFAVNYPDSAIVLGSKSGEPSGGPYVRKDGTVALTAEWDIGEDRAIRAERLEARDAEGLRLEDDGGNLGILVADGGNVAVGAAGTFGSKFAVVHTSNDVASFEVDGTYARVYFVSYRDSALTHGEFKGRASRGSKASPSAIQSGDLLFAIRAEGYGTNQWPGGNTAEVSLEADGAHTNSSQPGRVVFKTAQSGSISSTEAMRIDSQQRVGMGVSSPQGKLHVHDGTAGMGLFTKTSVTNTPQTILPNGTGDVVKGVAGTVITDDGTTTNVTSTLALRQGGTTTFDVTAGTSTWRTTLNADGSLTVARTAGTGTATISYHLHWM